MGRQRPALRRLGDVSPQRLARRSQSHLRLADQRLVRPGHSALRRRRQNLASARNAAGRNDRRPTACPKAKATNSSTTRRRTASPSPRTSGTTARSIPGNSSASGISSLRSPIPTPSTPASKTRPSSKSTDGGKNWNELAGLRGHGTGPKWQPGAGGMGLHTIILDPSESQANLHRHLRRGAFRTDDGGKTWKPINKGLLLASTFPIPTPKSATASTTSP